MNSGSLGTEVLGPEEISRALTRIAHEILERNKGAEDVILLGIPTRGVPLAQRLGRRIIQAEGGPKADLEHLVGTLDITMHRDDLRANPTRALTPTDLPPRGVDDAIVVLVDDVLYSGRTVRAALEAIYELGIPRADQLVMTVHRGTVELSICGTFID